jgi:hypothetical protein
VTELIFNFISCSGIFSIYINDYTAMIWLADPLEGEIAGKVYGTLNFCVEILKLTYETSWHPLWSPLR